jgi:hypothetical protein
MLRPAELMSKEKYANNARRVYPDTAPERRIYPTARYRTSPSPDKSGVPSALCADPPPSERRREARPGLAVALQSGSSMTAADRSPAPQANGLFRVFRVFRGNPVFVNGKLAKRIRFLPSKRNWLPGTKAEAA